MKPVLYTVMFLFLGCGSDTTNQTTPAENPKNMVLTSPKHAQANPDDFSKKSFTCCDSPFGNQLLEKYLALTQAMAADDDAKTKSAAAAFHQFVNSPEFASAATTEKDLAAFPKASQLWVTLDRKGIQQDFSDVSATMVKYAQNHKAEKGTKVIGAFCPMAPGKWLQVETELRNPYFGSEMLTCGIFE